MSAATVKVNVLSGPGIRPAQIVLPMGAASDSVGDLKLRLCEAMDGVHVSRMRFILSGRVLRDGA